MAPPMGGDSGNSARPGTKKTGNHLAKMAAPGDNASKIPAATDGATASVMHKEANSRMQAPKAAGYWKSAALKHALTTCSMTAKTAVPANALGSVFATEAPPRGMRCSICCGWDNPPRFSTVVAAMVRCGCGDFDALPPVEAKARHTPTRHNPIEIFMSLDIR